MTLLDIGSYLKFFFLILCLNHKLPDKIVYKIIITFETFQISKYIQTYPAVKLEELGEVEALIGQKTPGLASNLTSPLDQRQI